MTDKKVSTINKILEYMFKNKLNAFITGVVYLLICKVILDDEILNRILQDKQKKTRNHGDKIKKIYLLDLFNYKFQHKYS